MTDETFEENKILIDNAISNLKESLEGDNSITLLLAGYSRLIVDCNRSLGHPEAFITKSENTFIPGNFNLSKAEKHNRAKLYCLPYRKKIKKNIDLRLKRKQIPVIISIHSFALKYKNIKRPWHLSVLYRKDKRLTSLVLKKLKKNQTKSFFSCYGGKKTKTPEHR